MLGRLLRTVEPVLRKVYHRLSDPSEPNLMGDRDVEYTWIAAKLQDGSGEAMDFGAGNFWLGLLAARKGYKVTSLDLTSVNWLYNYPDLHFVQTDLFDFKAAPGQFSLIMNCSAIEHVGLVGRYGMPRERENGDIEAMRYLSTLTKPGGTMLLTIPVGQDEVFMPFHRVYGAERLPRLLDKWDVVEKEFWTKDQYNRWQRVAESVAVSRKAEASCYSLGLYVLRKAV